MYNNNCPKFQMYVYILKIIMINRTFMTLYIPNIINKVINQKNHIKIFSILN